MTSFNSYQDAFTSPLAQHEIPSKTNGFNTYDAIRKLPAMDGELARSQPWKNDPHFFKTVQISTLALMKMAIHAQSGGLIEVMGMITGKITRGVIIAMDVYSLPVEGTETRVNAQAEGYEYMVEYMQMSKKVKDENIVGWYHSHPGYGCWLSGIDVSTQALNQNFQDPYLALVVDPVQTTKQKKVEIGAFRTLPDGHHESFKSAKTHNKLLPRAKRTDYGAHCDKYYKLDIEIFHSPFDSRILTASLKNENHTNASWIMSLLDNSVTESKTIQTESTRDGISAQVSLRHDKSLSLLDKYEICDESLEEIHSLVKNLKKHEPYQPSTHTFSQSVLRNYNATFEEMISSRMARECNRSETASRMASPDADMEKESDIDDYSEAKAVSLDISDHDDQQSLDSTSIQMDADDTIHSKTPFKESIGSENKMKAKEFVESLNSSDDRGEKRPRSPRNSETVYPRLKLAVEEARTIHRAHDGASSVGFLKDQAHENRIDRIQVRGQSQDAALLSGGQDERRKERRSNTPLAQAVRLAKLIGQRDLQNMITLDAQAQLFSSCRLSKNLGARDNRDISD